MAFLALPTRIVSFLVALVLLLGGCIHAPSKPRSPAKLIVTQEDYIGHLALSRLAFVQNAPIDSITSHLKALEHYKPKQKKRRPIIILVIEYKVKEQTLQQLAVAVEKTEKGMDFPHLASILRRLDTLPHTLHNLYAYRVSAPTALRKKELKIDTPQALHVQLEERHKKLVADARKLPPLENADVQMALAHFFLREEIRDGAYLAIENAKQSLAAAVEGKAAGTAELEERLNQMEQLEKNLHKAMPFTLG